jgi:hypothetical protein
MICFLSWLVSLDYITRYSNLYVDKSVDNFVTYPQPSLYRQSMPLINLTEPVAHGVGLPCQHEMTDPRVERSPATWIMVRSTTVRLVSPVLSNIINKTDERSEE